MAFSGKQKQILLSMFPVGKSIEIENVIFEVVKQDGDSMELIPVSSKTKTIGFIVDDMENRKEIFERFPKD